MDNIRVDLPIMNNKWVGFELANVDTFIIHIGFGLANINTIRILTRHEHDSSIRIATPNLKPMGVMKPTAGFTIYIYWLGALSQLQVLIYLIFLQNTDCKFLFT